jgi:hypothetical protein
VWEATGLRPRPSREAVLGSLRAPTLGREAELERLRSAIERVGAQRIGDRILVVAPPGVGKSRLLAELAGATDAAVLRARVRPQGTAPYETVGQLFDGVEPEALRAALTAMDVAPTRVDVIVEQVARLREPVGEGRAGTGDLAAERDARFEAWTTALDAMSDRAALWLIEDVHWAGPDLLAFLDHAGGAATRHGRLVVTTARPSLLESAPAWCETDRMDLAPLPPTDAAALVRALVGDALPDALVDAVVVRSDGTPLFIEELIRTWASVGTLVADGGDGGGWRLAVQPEAVVLPPTVQAIYAAQLDDLPADARLVARRGAVAGRRVPLGALASLELADRREGLDVLRRRDFLAGPLHDDVTGDAFAYRHALLRDAGYASLARVERARLHLAMAAWLEQVAGERTDVVAEAIAEHFAQALDSLPALTTGDLPDRAALARTAAGWYERAAGAALRLAAHEAARRLLERSIELTDADAPLDLARRRLQLGRLLAESADLDAGIGHLEASMQGFEEALPDAAAGFAAAAYALGSSYMQQIRFPETSDLASRALAALDAAGAEEPAGRSRLMALHAWSRAAHGRPDDVLEEARRAEELAATVGDPVLELDVLERATAARSEVDEQDDGAWAEIARRAVALERWEQAVIASRIQAMGRGDSDPASALAGIDAAAELAQAHGMTEQAGWCELARCETLFVTGDWTDALEAGLRAIDLAERYAYIRLAFRTWMVVLPILAARRAPELIERHDRWWRDAEQHFPASPSPYGRFLTAAVGVWRARARDAEPPVPDDALASLDVAFSNPHFRAAIETVCEAWLAAGRLDPARALAAVPMEDDATPLMLASSALLHAWLAQADGDREAARTFAGEAADRARPLGATWWLARALRVLEDPEADALERRLGL